MKIKFIILLFSVFMVFQLQAQPLAKLKSDGMALFNEGKYRESLVLLQGYQRQKGDDRDIIRALGISAYYSNQLPIAKQMLSALQDDKKTDPSVFLFLGRTLHQEMDFKGAVKTYKEFLRRAKYEDVNRRAVIADVKRCATGMKVTLQSELALVENLGENVNSLHDEFAPVQSPNDEDKIYFSASREDAEGGLRTEEGLSDLKNGKYVSDIYFTAFDGGDWVIPEHLNNGLINTARHEVLLDFTNNGKNMFFFRGLTQFSGEVLVDTFKSETEVRSLPPQFLGPMNSFDGDNSLQFFNDSILIFSSRKAGGYGGTDLYYSVLSEGRWQPAKNMGSAINSPFDETTPYLTKDGRTLYFSSNSMASMGGFDVFKSTFDEDSLRFMKAVNLNRPINSVGDDTHFRLAPDGLKAYFSSNRRESSYGGRDIYTALFKNTQKEQNPSIPVIFYMVEAYKARQAQLGETTTVSKIAQYTLKPIFYDNDDDVLRGENLNQVKAAIGLVKQFSALKIVLTMNTNEGEKTSFDIYFGMKRAEKIAKYCVDNGLPSSSILIKSVGANYPVAKSFLEGVPNPAGEKMNRRVDLTVANVTTEPVKINYDMPTVSQFMVEPIGDIIKKHKKGLSYKVQVISTKRIFDNDILKKYGDSMSEASGTEGVYQYSVGLATDFKSADKIRQDITKDGFKDAWVVPYVDGIRVIGDEAKKYSKTHPDLLNYINYKKKP
jgi:outer membrane protein OmpA-like peptidoglycan-associated protein